MVKGPQEILQSTCLLNLTGWIEMGNSLVSSAQHLQELSLHQKQESDWMHMFNEYEAQHMLASHSKPIISAQRHNAMGVVIAAPSHHKCWDRSSSHERQAKQGPNHVAISAMGSGT